RHTRCLSDWSSDVCSSDLTRRLKLFYAAQARDETNEALSAIKFVLFVNQPKLLSDTYARYLERRVRAVSPFPGLPLLFSCRARRSEERRVGKECRAGESPS